MRTFHCNRCEQLVFFENVRCERCEALLGYLPDLGELSAFEEAGDGLWRSLHPKAEGALYRQCHNYAVENVCNWMIPADQPETLCRSCQLTRTIPNLTAPDNRLYWYRLEVAKRRLLYTLAALGIKVESRHENPQTGLEFEFLEETSPGEKVLTGHDNGLITLNIAEADDAYRERTRTAMHEPYRTLLGHFRHEIGHYYYYRLITPSIDFVAKFNELFGDANADYQEALDRHYSEGAPPFWQNEFVSAYAATHPWEDFAETWAHYLHIVDTLETARAFGIKVSPRTAHGDLSAEVDFDSHNAASMAQLIGAWLPIAFAFNSLNRSMGQPDLYPFVLAPRTIEKLGFVHRLTHPAARAARRIKKSVMA